MAREPMPITLHVRVTPETVKLIDWQAERLKIARSDYVRRLIDKGLSERQGHKGKKNETATTEL